MREERGGPRGKETIPRPPAQIQPKAIAALSPASRFPGHARAHFHARCKAWARRSIRVFAGDLDPEGPCTGAGAYPRKCVVMSSPRKREPSTTGDCGYCTIEPATAQPRENFRRFFTEFSGVAAINIHVREECRVERPPTPRRATAEDSFSASGDGCLLIAATGFFVVSYPPQGSSGPFKRPSGRTDI